MIFLGLAVLELVVLGLVQVPIIRVYSGSVESRTAVKNRNLRVLTNALKLYTFG
jgi:hypothetical protein